MYDELNKALKLLLCNILRQNYAIVAKRFQ